jgi:hypothetical protein
MLLVLPAVTLFFFTTGNISSHGWRGLQSLLLMLPLLLYYFIYLSIGAYIA